MLLKWITCNLEWHKWTRNSREWVFRWRICQKPIHLKFETNFQYLWFVFALRLLQCNPINWVHSFVVIDSSFWVFASENFIVIQSLATQWIRHTAHLKCCVATYGVTKEKSIAKCEMMWSDRSSWNIICVFASNFTLNATHLDGSRERNESKTSNNAHSCFYNEHFIANFHCSLRFSSIYSYFFSRFAIASNENHINYYEAGHKFWRYVHVLMRHFK